MHLLSVKREMLSFVLLLFAIQLLIMSYSYSYSISVEGSEQKTIIPIIFDESHLDSSSRDSVILFNHESSMQKPLRILTQLDRDSDFVADFNVSINEQLFTDSFFDEIGPRGILIITLLDKTVGFSESRAIKSNHISSS